MKKSILLLLFLVGWVSPFGTAATTDLPYRRQIIRWWLWSNWSKEDWQWKPKYSNNLSTINPTRSYLGSNPELRGGKPELWRGLPKRIFYSHHHNTVQINLKFIFTHKISTVEALHHKASENEAQCIISLSTSWRTVASQKFPKLFPREVLSGQEAGRIQKFRNWRVIYVDNRTLVVHSISNRLTNWIICVDYERHAFLFVCLFVCSLYFF